MNINIKISIVAVLTVAAIQVSSVALSGSNEEKKAVLKTNVSSCGDNWRRLQFLTAQWGKILYPMHHSKEILSGKSNFTLVDAQKLRFSLPGDNDFNKEPDHEFFKPDGKFAAKPIPQEVIDSLTTIKGTRPLFNLRKFHQDDDGAMELPIYDFVYLYVVIPNALPACDSGEGIGWDEKSYKNKIVSPDNRSVVDDGSYTPFIKGADGKNYLLKNFGPNLWRRDKN